MFSDATEPIVIRSLNVISDAAEPIVIRANTFTNTYHAVAIQGRNVHVLENTDGAEGGR